MKFQHLILHPALTGSVPAFDSRFTLEEGAYAGQSFAAQMSFCSSPTCACATIGMGCHPLRVADGGTPADPQDSPPRWVDFNLFDRKVSHRKDSTPAEESLARAMDTEMQAGDWQMLMEQFRVGKQALMQSMDLDTIDAFFPPEVAEDGAMIGYREVFPWAEERVFKLGEQQWFVEDAYCAKPDCDCSGVGLEIFRVPGDPAERTEPQRSAVRLLFDYKTGKSQIEHHSPGCPEVSRLMAALRSAHPTLNADLRHRHDQIRQLGRRLIGKRRRKSKGWRSLFGGGRPAPEDDDAPEQPVASEPLPPSAGRNDPCPCGSGKKFKKCCGKG